MPRFSYDELMDHFKDSEVSYERNSGGSIKIVGTNFPWSIDENEFEYFFNKIVDNDLKAGYELATGTGVSALAAGLAFKITGGNLLTLDAYVEETENRPNAGQDFEIFRSTGKEARGFRSITQLIDKYELEGVVFPIIGWSPDDVFNNLEEVGLHECLDFVFFDAGSWEDRFLADFNAIINCINTDKFVVLVHDSQTISNDIKEYMRERLGVEGKKVTCSSYCLMVFEKLA